MKRYVATKHGKWLVRGPWTVVELRAQFAAFCRKYGETLTWEQWLVQRGKAY